MASSSRVLLATGAVLVLIGTAAGLLVHRQLQRLDRRFTDLTTATGSTERRVHLVDSLIVQGRPVVFRGDTIGRLSMALSADAIEDRPRFGPTWTGGPEPPPPRESADGSAPDIRIVYFADLTHPGSRARLRSLRALSASMKVEGRDAVVLDTVPAPDTVSAQLWLGRDPPIRISLTLDGPITRLVN
jgi:hypothetical protein